MWVDCQHRRAIRSEPSLHLSTGAIVHRQRHHLEICIFRDMVKLLFLFLSTSVPAWSGGAPMAATAQHKIHHFTVADDIGVTMFGNPDGSPAEPRFSPDGEYFVVWT